VTREREAARRVLEQRDEDIQMKDGEVKALKDMVRDAICH